VARSQADCSSRTTIKPISNTGTATSLASAGAIAYEFADALATFGLDADGKPRRLEMRLYRDTIEAIRK
jgi:hypothetical protein